jgi:hypothetical protein
LSDAPIPWPIGKRGRGKTFVGYLDLADAIRSESNQTVCELWGISPQTVSKWRKTLGVEKMNAGSVKRFQQMVTTERKAKMQTALKPSYSDPERNEKIRQSRKGKPRPKHVIEAMQKGRNEQRSSAGQK